MARCRRRPPRQVDMARLHGRSRTAVSLGQSCRCRRFHCQCPGWNGRRQGGRATHIIGEVPTRKTTFQLPSGDGTPYPWCVAVQVLSPPLHEPCHGQDQAMEQKHQSAPTGSDTEPSRRRCQPSPGVVIRVATGPRQVLYVCLGQSAIEAGRLVDFETSWCWSRWRTRATSTHCLQPMPR